MKKKPLWKFIGREQAREKAVEQAKVKKVMNRPGMLDLLMGRDPKEQIDKDGKIGGEKRG